MATKEIRTDSLRAWLLAARPKTLTGAAVPVMLGCGLAAADGGFVLLPAVLCFAFALLMQIDANLINDLWDYLKGSDGEDRLGPERACAQGWITPKSMRLGIAATTLAACAAGCGLIAYGGWWAHRRRRRLRPLRIPLHGRALPAGLPRLGRHARIAFLRIRPRRLHVLRPLRRLDMAGGGHRGSLRPGDRHTADGQQLP